MKLDQHMPGRLATRAKQRGAVLFVSLMFLIILTLIGLSAANVGILQERMAGNVYDSNIAFQRAEAVLRDVEQRIRTITNTGGSGGLGAIENWGDIQTNFNVAQGDCTLEAANFTELDGMWRTSLNPDVPDGEFVVVQLSGGTVGTGGSPCRPVQGQSAGNPGQLAVFYLIAARAPGPTGNADAVVQTIYFWP